MVKRKKKGFLDLFRKKKKKTFSITRNLSAEDQWKVRQMGKSSAPVSGVQRKEWQSTQIPPRIVQQLDQSIKRGRTPQVIGPLPPLLKTKPIDAAKRNEMLTNKIGTKHMRMANELLGQKKADILFNKVLSGEMPGGRLQYMLKDVEKGKLRHLGKLQTSAEDAAAKRELRKPATAEQTLKTLDTTFLKFMKTPKGKQTAKQQFGREFTGAELDNAIRERKAALATEPKESGMKRLVKLFERAEKITSQGKEATIKEVINISDALQNKLKQSNLDKGQKGVIKKEMKKSLREFKKTNDFSVFLNEMDALKNMSKFMHGKEPSQKQRKAVGDRGLLGKTESQVFKELRKNRKILLQTEPKLLDLLENNFRDPEARLIAMDGVIRGGKFKERLLKELSAPKQVAETEEKSLKKYLHLKTATQITEEKAEKKRGLKTRRKSIGRIIRMDPKLNKIVQENVAELARIKGASEEETYAYIGGIIDKKIKTVTPKNVKQFVNELTTAVQIEKERLRKVEGERKPNVSWEAEPSTEDLQRKKVEERESRLFLDNIPREYDAKTDKILFKTLKEIDNVKSKQEKKKIKNIMQKLEKNFQATGDSKIYIERMGEVLEKAKELSGKKELKYKLPAIKKEEETMKGRYTKPEEGFDFEFEGTDGRRRSGAKSRYKKVSTDVKGKTEEWETIERKKPPKKGGKKKGKKKGEK